MRLRFILSIVFAVLLVLTDALIVRIGYSSSHKSLKQLTEHEFALANGSAANEIGNFLDDPATHMLDELCVLASRGLLAKDDKLFGFYLAERLRVNDDLAWISYSDAKTGRFVGVWRKDDGEVVLNRSTPGKGPAIEEIVTEHGKEIPFSRPSPANYDPRTFSWFKNAIHSDGPVWSEPYHFVHGDLGVTASRAWWGPDSQSAEGVFTVDFKLDDLEHLLSTLTGHTRGFSCVVELSGSLFCSSPDGQKDVLSAALGDWIKSNPEFKNTDSKQTSHLIPLKVNGKKYLAALDRVQTPSGFKCIVASMVPESVIYAGVDRATAQMVLVSIVGLALAIMVGWFLAHRISQPLQVLGKDLARVGKFDLTQNEKTSPSLVQEVNQLRDSADRMRSGLRSFLRYVPDDLVRQVLKSGKEATLGGEIRRLTLFFSDIEGFTAYSENVTPEILVQELSDYFDILSQTLWKHSGTIDKFIGDGLLGFFNAPLDVPDQERMACLATLEVLGRLEVRAQEKGIQGFRTRVGLHAGEVLVGNIGTPLRFAYTVLGDVVNLASRLESLNKIYGTQVIASQEVREKAGDDFEWRHLDRISVAGRKGQTDIYELLGQRGNVPEDYRHFRDDYQKALGDYFNRSFKEAHRLFARLAESHPQDKAVQLMVVRCEHMQSAQLPSDWDGVFAYTVK